MFKRRDMMSIKQELRLLGRRYPFIKQLYFTFLSIVRLPFKGAMQYIAHKYGFEEDTKEFIFILVGNNLPVTLRRNKTDIKIFEQIFLLEDCSMSIDGFQPKTIVDGGAHIGCATIYFSLKYPNARIISVEAEANNYRQLCINVADLPNVQTMHAAIHGHKGWSIIDNPEDEGWNFRTRSVDNPSHEQAHKLPNVTIEDLIRISGGTKIDLLKLDIEGAEIEVFSENTTWLGFVDTINIELHDNFRPGCSDAFLRAVAEYDAVTKNTIHNCLWIKKTIFSESNIFLRCR